MDAGGCADVTLDFETESEAIVLALKLSCCYELLEMGLNY